MSRCLLIILVYNDYDNDFLVIHQVILVSHATTWKIISSKLFFYLCIFWQVMIINKLNHLPVTCLLRKRAGFPFFLTSFFLSNFRSTKIAFFAKMSVLISKRIQKIKKIVLSFFLINLAASKNKRNFAIKSLLELYYPIHLIQTHCHQEDCTSMQIHALHVHPLSPHSH